MVGGVTLSHRVSDPCADDDKDDHENHDDDEDRASAAEAAEPALLFLDLDGRCADGHALVLASAKEAGKLGYVELRT
jgi:hypothetical protein